MPQRALRECAKSDCSALTNQRFCDAHRDYDRRSYDKLRRNHELKRLYDTPRWQSVRQLILQRDILCSMCIRALSMVVHHKIAAAKWVAQGGDFYDPSNLAGCCKPCHDRHTATVDSTFAGAH